MSEKPECPHKADGMCSCEPIKAKDPIHAIVHFLLNVRDAVWELDYEDLNKPEERRLCLAGVCGLCGGRLCFCMTPAENLTGEDFLAAAYSRLKGFHDLNGQRMDSEEFRKRFVRLFHEPDRPHVRQWLEKYEDTTDTKKKEV